jgi:predicted nucleic-acid-binding Zn-ribbon protein
MVVFYSDEYTCPKCGSVSIPIDNEYVEATGNEINAIDIIEK